MNSPRERESPDATGDEAGTNILARRPPEPFPLTILTGFLGAGKTSLLNRLLRDPELTDCLVIINEFGEIGLDHLLVEAVDGDMLVMTSGCLCCSIRGDLVATLEDVLRRRDNDRIAPFRRVVIETTGLADPAPVLHTIMYHPYLVLRFRLDGVVTLVDAVNGAATLDAHEEAVKQAAVADRIVLTKTDLLGSDETGRFADLSARLARLNPGAPRFDAARGEATAAALLSAGLYDPSKKSPDVAHWLNADAYPSATGHGGPGRHVHPHDTNHDHDGHTGHDPNRHDARIRAFCLRHEAPISPQSFDIFIELLRSAHGPKLLRVKGIIALADDLARPVVVHGVQHVFHPPARLDAWPDGDHSTRIVFILKDMERGFIEGLWRAFTGGATLDSPDPAAISNNPLAPAKRGLVV
jgi:G3E family GTPase